MWPDFGEEFLYALLKAKSMKEKTDKLKLIKIKNFSAKANWTQTTLWEEMVTKHLPNKLFLFEI